MEQLVPRSPLAQEFFTWTFEPGVVYRFYLENGDQLEGRFIRTLPTTGSSVDRNSVGHIFSTVKSPGAFVLYSNVETASSDDDRPIVLHNGVQMPISAAPVSLDNLRMLGTQADPAAVDAARMSLLRARQNEELRYGEERATLPPPLRSHILDYADLILPRRQIGPLRRLGGSARRKKHKTAKRRITRRRRGTAVFR
jgi:hypothetical protein